MIVGGTKPFLMDKIEATASIAPAAPNNTGVVSVSMSVDGIESGEIATFTYTPSVVVTAVTPSSGASGGGTVVTFSGSNFLFSTALRCRFGAVDVTANFVTDEEIRCKAPQLPPDSARQTATATWHVDDEPGQFALQVEAAVE